METCLHGQRRSLDRLRMRFLGLGFEALKLDFLDDGRDIGEINLLDDGFDKWHSLCSGVDSCPVLARLPQENRKALGALVVLYPSLSFANSEFAVRIPVTAATTTPASRAF